MMKRVIVLVLSLIMLVCLFPSAALALGVAMGPTTLEIQDAMRGSEYQRTVTVFNPSAEETKYVLRVEGQALSWVSLHDLNTQAAIQGLTIAGQSNTTILLKVKVPSESPNGSYTATVYAETAPAENTGEMGMSSVLQASAVLTVTVSGTQIIKGEVLSIQANDTETGLPFLLLVNFKNTGNVAVKPQIDCLIARGAETVGQLSSNQKEVGVESTEAIPLEWDTVNNPLGDYTARVSVQLNGELLTTRELSFKVLATGTLTRQGEFTSLKYEGQPELGNILKIYAGFQNTGEGTTRAKFIGEAYLNGVLVDTLQSEESIVTVGQTGSLLAYYKPVKDGNYTIKGYVSYEGKQTAVKEVAFDLSTTGIPVTSGPGQSTNPPVEGGQSRLPYYIVGGVILVMFIGVVILIMGKKSGKSRGK